jgi:hypothetical protein
MTSGGVSVTQRLPVQIAEIKTFAPVRQVLPVELGHRSQQIATSASWTSEWVSRIQSSLEMMRSSGATIAGACPSMTPALA